MRPLAPGHDTSQRNLGESDWVVDGQRCVDRRRPTETHVRTQRAHPPGRMVTRYLCDIGGAPRSVRAASTQSRVLRRSATRSTTSCSHISTLSTGKDDWPSQLARNEPSPSRRPASHARSQASWDAPWTVNRSGAATATGLTCARDASPPVLGRRPDLRGCQDDIARSIWSWRALPRNGLTRYMIRTAGAPLIVVAYGIL